MIPSSLLSALTVVTVRAASRLLPPKVVDLRRPRLDPVAVVNRSTLLKHRMMATMKFKTITGEELDVKCTERERFATIYSIFRNILIDLHVQG